VTICADGKVVEDVQGGHQVTPRFGYEMMIEMMIGGDWRYLTIHMDMIESD
jgi:hypothetical protein